MKRSIVLIVVVLITCGYEGLAQGVPEGAGRIEELLGVMVDPEGVIFQVRTGGCTRPENFRVERFGQSPTQLLVVRTVADRCEAFVPYGTTFKLSYTQLHLGDRESFVIVNPLASVQVIRF